MEIQQQQDAPKIEEVKKKVTKPTYTFAFYDIGNNEIKTDNPSLPTFQIWTTRGFMGILKCTTLLCLMGEDTQSRVQGEINWNEKKIMVGDKSGLFSEIMHETGGLFDSSREWKWTSGKYTTTRDDGIWTVKRRGGKQLAMYTPPEINTFSKNEPAKLKFLVDVPNEEKVFLVLILLFRDLQKQSARNEPKSVGQTAGEVAVKAAVNVGTNVALGCCVIS